MTMAVAVAVVLDAPLAAGRERDRNLRRQDRGAHGVFLREVIVALRGLPGYRRVEKMAERLHAVGEASPPSHWGAVTLSGRHRPGPQRTTIKKEDDST